MGDVSERYRQEAARIVANVKDATVEHAATVQVVNPKSRDSYGEGAFVQVTVFVPAPKR